MLAVDTLPGVTLGGEHAYVSKKPLTITRLGTCKKHKDFIHITVVYIHVVCMLYSQCIWIRHTCTHNFMFCKPCVHQLHIFCV